MTLICLKEQQNIVLSVCRFTETGPLELPNLPPFAPWLFQTLCVGSSWFNIEKNKEWLNLWEPIDFTSSYAWLSLWVGLMKWKHVAEIGRDGSQTAWNLDEIRVKSVSNISASNISRDSRTTLSLRYWFSTIKNNFGWRRKWLENKLWFWTGFKDGGLFL